ncbi:class I SAM-dependent methyltransferase [Thalassotalea atypica]|uniref:class I SAM-dependent methyltransferase n=1 Tax=Thalassotalea atypica TaxID=2054316 RepID=UPI002573CE34|nr:class I SAM-dependent methyltransferase [Thalassotalea atypica]
MFEHIQINDLSQCQRIFHGRGHAYPGFEHINVDWLSPVILITLYKESPEDFIDQLAQELQQRIPSCRSVQVQHRWQKLAPFELVRGEKINHTTVDENGLNYHIELGRAQNTGLFLDMRHGRQWVREKALGKNVLNLFSYTCAFSVAAIDGGARQVVNVDLSKPSLAKGRENHRLNNHSTESVVFQGVDIFKSYGRLKKYGPYELLIADPPSFQKGSVNIQRDYGKIIRRIPQLLKPEGLAMLCLNSPDLDDKFLLEEVARECPECQLLERIEPPHVFKEAHQGKGLKVLIFQYNPGTTSDKSE